MKAVEEFILNYPGPQKEVLGFLHQHFEAAGLKAKIAYGLPFYDGRKWICYLHPLKNSSQTELCFTRAHQFEDPSGLLKARNRKQIKGLIIEDLESIPLEEINRILEAAIALDNS